MTNPYAAPEEKSETASGPTSHRGLIGIGCFLAVLLGLFLLVSALFFVARPVPAVVPGPAPTGTTAPPTTVPSTPAPTVVEDRTSESGE